MLGQIGEDLRDRVVGRDMAIGEVGEIGGGPFQVGMTIDQARNYHPATQIDYLLSVQRG